MPAERTKHCTNTSRSLSHSRSRKTPPPALSTSSFNDVSNNPSTTAKSNSSPDSPWTGADDRILLATLEDRSQTCLLRWTDIAQACFPDRRHLAHHCLARAKTMFSDARRVKGPWSSKEDEFLCRLVDAFGPEHWVEIACRHGTRNGKQCRERWHNQLGPGISKAPFSPEEEATIRTMVSTIGPKWAIISKALPGRPDNSIKNHWNAQMNRLGRANRQAHKSLKNPPSPISPQHNPPLRRLRPPAIDTTNHPGFHAHHAPLPTPLPSHNGVQLAPPLMNSFSSQISPSPTSSAFTSTASPTSLPCTPTSATSAFPTIVQHPHTSANSISFISPPMTPDSQISNACTPLPPCPATLSFPFGYFTNPEDPNCTRPLTAPSSYPGVKHPQGLCLQEIDVSSNNNHRAQNYDCRTDVHTQQQLTGSAPLSNHQSVGANMHGQRHHEFPSRSTNVYQSDTVDRGYGHSMNTEQHNISSEQQHQHQPAYVAPSQHRSVELAPPATIIEREMPLFPSGSVHRDEYSSTPRHPQYTTKQRNYHLNNIQNHHMIPNKYTQSNGASGEDWIQWVSPASPENEMTSNNSSTAIPLS